MNDSSHIYCRTYTCIIYREKITFGSIPIIRPLSPRHNSRVRYIPPVFPSCNFHSRTLAYYLSYVYIQTYSRRRIYARIRIPLGIRELVARYPQIHPAITALVIPRDSVVAVGSSRYLPAGSVASRRKLNFEPLTARTSRLLCGQRCHGEPTTR